MLGVARLQLGRLVLVLSRFVRGLCFKVGIAVRLTDSPRNSKGLVRHAPPQRVTPAVEVFEQFGQARVIDRAAIGVAQQVLLADIGDIARIAVFGEQVVERLFAVGADFLGDRFVPFLAIGEDRVHIVDHAAKIEDPVAHNVADPEPGAGPARRIDIAASLRGKERSAVHRCQYRAPSGPKQRPVA